MAVGDTSFPKMFPVAGFKLASAAAGVRYADRDDVVLMVFDDGAEVAGSFTQNAFSAAPVLLCRQKINNPVRALITNSGTANACTGEAGLYAAEETCRAVANQLGVETNQVLPFSTGVIGEILPHEKIISALPKLATDLERDNWELAARAIMTTDTYPKGASCQIDIDGRWVTVTGIAKGSGMIKPNMATMLAYVATDAAIAPELLKTLHKELVDESFNRVSVDGDTSTNDSAILVATGRAENRLIEERDSQQANEIYAALKQVYQTLSQALIRDAEGATKFVTLQINGGAQKEECLKVGYAIAESPLVKTALFASDPNWGRIVAAIGYAGIDGLDSSQIDIYLDTVQIVKNGERAADYREELGSEVFAQSEFTVRVELGRGAVNETLWTSDLSHDYIRINAEYRT